MRWKSHVRFGGRAGETHPSKDGQGASVRPNTQKVREGGRVVNVAAVIATAANAEGRREIVGFDIVTTEDTASWTEFLRGLVARGLAGVELVISDAHGGIKAAIAQVLSGASWQRCRTHYAEDRIMWTGCGLARMSGGVGGSGGSHNQRALEEGEEVV